MAENKGLAQWFGTNLAELLADKIITIYPGFDTAAYIKTIKKECPELGYSKRIELHVDVLHDLLGEKTACAYHGNPDHHITPLRFYQFVLEKLNNNAIIYQ